MSADFSSGSCHVKIWWPELALDKGIPDLVSHKSAQPMCQSLENHQSQKIEFLTHYSQVKRSSPLATIAQMLPKAHLVYLGIWVRVFPNIS